MQYLAGATASNLRHANKVDTLYFKMALITLVIDISIVRIIHHLDIIDDNTTDYHYNTPYAYQFNTYMVRNHIDVNSLPFYSTIYTCDFVRLIIQQQPITL